MSRFLLLIGLTLPLLCAQGGRGEERPTGYVRWAVIPDPNVSKTGLNELVLGSLQKLKGVEVVEKARVDKLLEERPLLDGFLSSVSERVKIGRSLGADALVLLSINRTRGESAVHVVLSECGLGASLTRETLPFNYSEKEKVAGAIAKTVLGVRFRFPAGLSAVIGVSDFVSEGLAQEPDALRTRYASVLRNALASTPGVAVTGTGEADVIGKELVRSTVARRTVSLVVEGRYRVEKKGEGKSDIDFDIALRDGEKEIRRIEREAMPSPEAGAFISCELVREILQEAKQDVSLAASRADQVKHLKERADRFALRGEWTNSTGFREAVLLVDPEAPGQRMTLVQEYRRFVSQDFNEAAKDNPGFKQEAGNRIWERIVQTRIQYWNRALEHVEYLVRNRQVTIPEISGEAEWLLDSICYVRQATKESFLPAEAAKKAFLRTVWPLVPELRPASPHATTRSQYHEEWFRVFIKNVLRRYDGNHLLKEDLDLLYEALERLSPEDPIPSSRLVFFLSDGLRYYRDHYKDIDLETDYKATLEKLTESMRPICAIYGRYGLLAYEWAKSRQVSRELYQESLDIQAAFRKTKTSNEHGTLAEKLSFTSGWIRRELDKQERPPQLTATAPHPQPEPAPRPADERGTGRLNFEELGIKVYAPDESISDLKGKRWSGYGGWGGITQVLKCGDSLDVFWQAGAVLFMRKAGILVEVFVDQNPIFVDVAWDGESVWIATRRDGIWIVDPRGWLKRKVSADDGLPDADRNIMLYAEKPGQVIAIGSFGDLQRSWCARITAAEGRKPECKVFHEATRVVQVAEKREELEANPGLCFTPRWLHRYDNGSDTPLLLIGRDAPSHAGRRRPLMIDLNTLKVSVLARDLHMIGSQCSESYFSRDGMILEASDFGVTLRPPPGQNLDDGKELRNLSPDKPGRSGVQGFFAKKLFLHEGWLYVPGGTWWRIDPKTFEAERLVPWRLPMELEELRHFGLTAHYGLIAWDKTFFKVTMKEEDGK